MNIDAQDFKEIDRLIENVSKEVILRKDTLHRVISICYLLKNKKGIWNKPPRGLLFFGPPGTGKTLLMKSLAKSLNVPFHIIRGPEIISQYYGATEGRLRNIFSIAQEEADKNGLSIIYIDEVDSITPKREVSHGDLEPRLVGQLLTLMDGLSGIQNKDSQSKKGNVLVIGSTNRREAVDIALRRPGRFDYEIEFEPPDEEERKLILNIILSNISKDPEVEGYLDIFKDETIRDKISKMTAGFTGADLENLINNAILNSVAERRNKVSQNDINKAIDNLIPSALREYHFETSEDQGIKLDPEICKKIEEFTRNKLFMKMGLNNNSYKIASQIAFNVNQRKRVKFMIVNFNLLKSRFYGETEKSIYDLFIKINSTTPIVVFLRNIDSVMFGTSEQANSAKIAFRDGLEMLMNNNKEVLLLYSIHERTVQDFENVL